MNLQHELNLRYLILFCIVFTASSFLFSFLSWGRAALGPPEISGPVLSGLIELGEHAAFGALAALPTRSLINILLGAICAVSIDVDHFGSVIGLPMDGRGSHAVPFALLVFVIIFLLARKRTFGQDISPLVAGSIALAAVVSHLALDAAVGGGDFPLWAPFSIDLVSIPIWGGILLEIVAAVLVWAAALFECDIHVDRRK